MQNKPKIYDVVKGGVNTIPTTAVVLGGMEGLVNRINAPDDWLDQPKRIIETNELAQQLLALLMRYFYNHCTPKPGELKMRLRYQRRIIYLVAPKDASFPETLKIYSPQYCGYLYHYGLLWGDRCGVCHERHPKQWLDKALLTLALGIDEGYVVHEPIDRPQAQHSLFLIVYGAYNEPARTIISSASSWKQACYSEAIYLCCVVGANKYYYQLLNCFEWIHGQWVQVEDNDIFPFPVSNVFDKEHKLIENK